MKRWLASTLAVLVLGTAASAQPQIGSYSRPVVSPRPTISPYLNLNRSGAGAAIDYYGLVRPQMETRNALQQLQSQVQTLEPTPGMLPNNNNQPPTTGRGGIGGFFNYSHFYPSLNRGGSGGVRR